MTRPRKGKRPAQAGIDTLFASALSLHESGKADQASALYRKILSLAPAHAGASHLLGVLALDSGNPREGARLIGRALAFRPDYPEAHFDLGRALLAMGQSNEAAKHLERAAGLAQDYAEPRQALGLASLETGRPDLALEWFEKALAIAPDNPALWLQTAWAFLHLHRPKDALGACAKAVALDPGFLQARLELAEMLIDLGRIEEALRELDAAQELDPSCAWLSFLKGRASLAAGDVASAERGFRRCLELDPEDSFGTAARLASLGAMPTPEQSSPAWVKRIYEGKARLWDQSMRSERGYQAPELLARVLMEPLESRSGLDVLDAGCGTGLCAPMLRPLARRLDGVDISPAMLEVAREKGLYDRLEEADLTRFLEAAPQSYDLILAAAVLIYLGELGPVLHAAFAALNPGGIVAFTFFPKDGDGYELTPTAYYRHSLDFVRQRARQAGFEITASLEGEHEYRDDQPVRGMALVLRKPCL